jgi:BolA protein
MAAVGGFLMSRAERITVQLKSALSPVHTELTDESHRHNVPAGAESHFNLLIVSAEFEGKRQIQRHQAVYRALADELESGLHALTLKTLSPTEWAGEGQAISPKCLGGSAGQS